MAIYHMSVKIIGRSAGRSAIACAAYRSGEKLHSIETDRTFDYSNKGGVIYSEITLCANAPERYLDRETLWNSVQAVENKSNSRLAREFEIALPVECTAEQWVQIGKAYAKYLAEQGMIVDWSIHNPINKDTGIAQNPHIHMMATTRPIQENGEWGVKEKKGYLLDENGERIPVIDSSTGEQKIGERGRKIWQRGLTDATGWDRKERVTEWRAAWADTVNKYLEPERQIDHRSYAEQGLDVVPTVHEGYYARKIEREGSVSELCEQNRGIKEYNLVQRAINAAKEQIAAITHEVERIKESLDERIRTAIIGIGETVQRIRDGVDEGKHIFEAAECRIAEAYRGIDREEPKITYLEQQDERNQRRINEHIQFVKARNEVIKAENDKIRSGKFEYAWEASGSNGTNLNKVYQEVGKELVEHGGLNILNKSGYPNRNCDRSYHGLVYIIKDKHIKKTEKILGNKPHQIFQTEYYGKGMSAVVFDGDRYDYDDKLKYIQSFYIYVNHKQLKPERSINFKYFQERVANTKNELQLERERYLAPEPQVFRESEIDQDKKQERTHDRGWDMEL